MAKNVSSATPEESDMLAAFTDDDNASVNSEQLMADIDECITESNEETEEIVEFLDSENESYATCSEGEKKQENDKPTTSARAGSSQVTKSDGYSELKVQLNQPIVLLSKLNQQDIAKYCSSSNKVKDKSGGADTSVNHKETGKSSDVKKSVWSDDFDDGSLSELSVSDFSLSDAEDDHVPTMLKQNLPDANTNSKVIKTDVERADKSKTNGERVGKDKIDVECARKDKIDILQVVKGKTDVRQVGKEKIDAGRADKRSSKEGPASSQSTSSKAQHSKSKSVLSPTQAKSSGASGPSASKSTDKFKEKSDSKYKTTAKNSPNQQNMHLKPDNTQQQGTKSLEQKENLSKGESERGAFYDRNKTWRYELILTDLNSVELTNESFRKFINLASDCAIHFAPPIDADKLAKGGVSLYFGDFAALQSAIQKLGQVMFTATEKLHGQIVGRQMVPLGKAETSSKANSSVNWKAANHVKMFFTLYTAWTEKLKQVVQIKDWKKADKRHEKFAQIPRVPMAVSKEFLSLLFPFSINIHSPNYQNAAEMTKSAKSVYPVDVQYATQELMEIVLGCFQDLSVTIPSALLPQTKLYVANCKPKAIPPGYKAKPYSTKPFRHEWIKHGQLFPCKRQQHRHQQHSHYAQHHHHYKQQQLQTVGNQKNVTQGKTAVNLHKANHQKGSSDHPSLSSSNPDHNRDRKRPASATEEKAMLLSGKKSRFSPPEKISTAQSQASIGDLGSGSTTNASHDTSDVKTMAEAQGLDPNNRDVLCILEMQKQLQSMQSLMSLPAPSTSERLSLSSVGEMESDSERSFEELEIAQAEQKLRESIALRQKQLHELEEKLKASKKKTQQSSFDANVSGTRDYDNTLANNGQALPPNQNDQPLDFNKPLPKVELAVKADEMRSKIKAAVNDPLSCFKKPFPVASKQSDVKAEDCALPLEFGKNVAKMIPKGIGRQASDRLSDSRSRERLQENRVQGSGAKNRNTPQKRTKVSRWSSVEDEDEAEGRGGSRNFKASPQRGQVVKDDGLLPTPSGSFATMMRGKRVAWESEPSSNTIGTKFLEQGVAGSGRNLMNKNKQGSRVKTRWSDPDQENEYDREYVYSTSSNSTDSLDSQNARSRYSVGVERNTLSGPAAGSGGNVQSSLSRARKPSSGLSIIEKLQREAFASGVGGVQVSHTHTGGPSSVLPIIGKVQEQAFSSKEQGDDSWTKRRGQNQGRLQEQFRDGDGQKSEYYEWEEGRNWEKQYKINPPSVGRGRASHTHGAKGGYGGVKGDCKPSSVGKGFEYESSSDRREERDYFGGDVDFNFNSAGRGEKGTTLTEYNDEEEDYRYEQKSSGEGLRQGFGVSWRRQESDNPVAAKRQKLDQYGSSDNMGQRLMGKRNQQYNGSERDGGIRGGSGVRGRGAGEASRGNRGGSTLGRGRGNDLNTERANVRVGMQGGRGSISSIASRGGEGFQDEDWSSSRDGFTRGDNYSGGSAFLRGGRGRGGAQRRRGGFGTGGEDASHYENKGGGYDCGDDGAGGYDYGDDGASMTYGSGRNDFGDYTQSKAPIGNKQQSSLSTQERRGLKATRESGTRGQGFGGADSSVDKGIGGGDGRFVRSGSNSLRGRDGGGGRGSNRSSDDDGFGSSSGHGGGRGFGSKRGHGRGFRSDVGSGSSFGSDGGSGGSDSSHGGGSGFGSNRGHGSRGSSSSSGRGGSGFGSSKGQSVSGSDRGHGRSSSSFGSGCGGDFSSDGSGFGSNRGYDGGSNFDSGICHGGGSGFGSNRGPGSGASSFGSDTCTSGGSGFGNNRGRGRGLGSDRGGGSSGGGGGSSGGGSGGFGSDRGRGRGGVSGFNSGDTGSSRGRGLHTGFGSKSSSSRGRGGSSDFKGDGRPGLLGSGPSTPGHSRGGGGSKRGREFETPMHGGVNFY